MTDSPEIRGLLTLSTAHVPGATAKLLNETPSSNWPISGGPHPYGWTLYAHDEVDDSCPEGLWPLYVFARTHGCDYIMFDCDVEPLEELPTYDW